MCETRALGIKWPQWQNMLFEAQVVVDMRVVLPAGRGEDVSEASQDGLLEEMGSKARM